jgi:hypothetical protein
MTSDSITFRLAIIMLKIMSPFVAIFGRVESLVLLLLHRPTNTSFRMFPPEDQAWTSRLVDFDIYAWHASCALTILLVVPYMAYSDRQHPGGGLSRLTRTLWMRSRLAALCLCLMRLWLVFSVWNYTLLKDCDNAIAQGLDSMPRPLVSRHPVLLLGSFWWLLT